MKSKHGIHKPKLYRTIIDYTYIKPPSYVVSSQYPKWIATMESKFDSLKIQSSCSLVPPLIDKNIATCKWVYKLKRHSFGTEILCKLDLVGSSHLMGLIHVFILFYFFLCRAQAICPLRN